MVVHKYLFMEIEGTDVTKKHIFRTRADGIRKIEKILNGTNYEVRDIIYRDSRHHKQEFICNEGELRFLIYRI